MPLLKPRKFDERALFLGDTQVPFHDPIAVDTAIQFAKYWKPTHLFLMGDMIDFYSVSSFDRNPERKLDIQEEADQTAAMLDEIVRAVGKDCIIHYVEGNHEYRLKKFLWRRAPELTFIRSLNVEHLLQLDKLGIKYVQSGTMLYHGFIVKHGHVVRRHSGYSARGELEDNGRSGISGHTHRLGQIYKTDFSGTYTWIENGCLCQLDPEYGEGKRMNWQQGFSYGMFRKKDDRFMVSTVPIVKGSVVFGDTEIVTQKVVSNKKAKKDIEYI